MNKAYQNVADEILKMLDAGVVPWQRPWAIKGGGPTNISSGKPYTGCNRFLLGIVAHVRGYTSNLWGTYRQVQAAGGQVRKGEKSTACVWYSPVQNKDADGKPVFKDGEPVMRPIAKAFRVFNLRQCDGLDHLDEDPGEATRLDCQQVVDGMPRPPKMVLGGDSAHYRPSTDTVTVPNPSRFRCEGDYWAATFHELAHSTGHSSRLDRHPQGWAQVGNDRERYSEEELVAEFCSSFLCGTVGVEPGVVENSASYIGNWKKTIACGDVAVAKAITAAGRAADYILGKES